MFISHFIITVIVISNSKKHTILINHRKNVSPYHTLGGRQHWMHCSPLYSAEELTKLRIQLTRPGETNNAGQSSSPEIKKIIIL